MEEMEEVAMKHPLPCRLKMGPTARASQMALVRLTERTVWIASSVRSMTGPGPTMPPLQASHCVRRQAKRTTLSNKNVDSAKVVFNPSDGLLNRSRCIQGHSVRLCLNLVLLFDFFGKLQCFIFARVIAKGQIRPSLGKGAADVGSYAGGSAGHDREAPIESEHLEDAVWQSGRRLVMLVVGRHLV
jgi:hypothetical protein